MNLSGSICALATPFGSDGTLDLDAFARLIERQIAGGTQAVVIAGSTGEAHALTDGEFEELVSFGVRRIAGRIPVLVGTGGANTAKTIAVTRQAKDLGADAALVVTPYYVRPTQDGLCAHYVEVADAGLPVVLYNVPGRTGCDLLPVTVARLAAHPNVVGIKEAVADAQRIEDLLALRSDTFRVLSGDDSTALRSLFAGADGVISVANNLVPVPFRALCDAARGGRRDAAAALDAQLQPLFDALGVESNPIPLKWGLALQGIGSSRPRLPLTELSPNHQDRLRDLLMNLQDAAA
ncbi:MAG TPA: 4-hydroxy-tetrahydrodipicolinate synthase [Tahibacter sp.]|uniref:4-hydroxy-tetrahydrodipicolinate synthase n=1 Tax=Tahibacter sp. TaxID=2056211 RepID=UPI002C11B000|nr:4-hydroxy-tetrahydrodipicolinate synthase [Tahibacter sp.]HSX61208.1 4-hydroxy-tetrahydrodipicolinate synthase [Tahibacter sp.]